MSKAYQITVVGSVAKTTKQTEKMKQIGLTPQRYFSVKLTEQQEVHSNGLRTRGQKKQFGMAIFENQHSSWFQDIADELEQGKFKTVNKRTKGEKEISDAVLEEYGIAGSIINVKFEPFYIVDALGKRQTRYDAVRKEQVDAIATIKPVFVEQGEDKEVAIERERLAMYNRGLFVNTSDEGDDTTTVDEEE